MPATGCRRRATSSTRLVARGEVVYGVTTGLRRPRHDVHPAGRRGPAPGEPARLARRGRRARRSRARSCARCSCCARTRSRSGTPGCRPLLVDRICALLEPWASIPSCRSRGASGPPGDLAPLAHLALPLIGRGAGRARRAGDAGARSRLRESGLEPLDARAQGGPGAPQRHAADVARSGRCSSPTPTAWSARRPSPRRCPSRRCWAPRSRIAAPYQLARPHPGQVAVAGRAAAPAARLRAPGARTTASAHKVQDPYSLRCVPQVHGAVRDALDHLRRVLDIELNSATDNPLVFPSGGEVPADALATGGGLVISRRQLPRRADRAGARLREARAVGAGRDLRAADGAARGPAAQRRAAGVPDARPGPEQRADDRPVHGRRPRVREQGPGPPVVGRLDPDLREPGGPRLDGRGRGPPRPHRPGARRADPRDRAARAAQALDLRLAALRGARGAAPGAGVAEAHGGSASGSPPRRGPRAGARPGARSRSSTTARWPTSRADAASSPASAAPSVSTALATTDRARCRRRTCDLRRVRMPLATQRGRIGTSTCPKPYARG